MCWPEVVASLWIKHRLTNLAIGVLFGTKYTPPPLLLLVVVALQFQKREYSTVIIDKVQKTGE